MDNPVALKRPEPIWTWPEIDTQLAQHISQELGIDLLLARILVQRKMTDLEEIQAYLDPTIDQFVDPRLLPDFEPAMKSILLAREQGELIYIHGDYDVDGITSAALFTRFLKFIGCKVVPHVPHRIREGYGIHLDAIQWAKDKGAKLFLTCDCGTSAHEQVEAAHAAGMRVVITDHHEPKETLPIAEAVVNPHREDSNYPFPELAGVGVVYKLCAGIAEECNFKSSQYYRAYADLAVLGTVADIMPLIGENRVIAKIGLPALEVSKKPGVQAIIDVCNLKSGRKVSTRTIGWQIGPRLNAVGRIDDAAYGLDLLLTDDPKDAKNRAEMLDRVNSNRREQQEIAVTEAMEMLATQDCGDKVLVVAKRGWHPGLVGIISGRITDAYYRPSFVVTLSEDGMGKASARSIPGFHLADAVNRTAHIHEGGGGHALAAGIKINGNAIDAFRKEINEYADTILTEDQLKPKYHIDAEANPTTTTVNAAQALRLMEPFGEANPEPLLACRNLRIAEVMPTRNPLHTRLTLQDEFTSVKAMVFFQGEEFKSTDVGSHMNVAYNLECNEFNGNVSPQWNIQLFSEAD